MRLACVVLAAAGCSFPGGLPAGLQCTEGDRYRCPAGQSCQAGVCVAGGAGPPDAATGELELGDDELDGEFDLGSFSSTEWNGNEVRLVAGATDGQFVSRVFDAGADVAWATIEWSPSAPYGKPLPDGAMAESGYPAGGVDMAGDVLLLHFDEEGPLPGGALVADGSGDGNQATVVSQGALNLVAGVVGRAVDVSPGNHLFVDTGSGSDLELGTSDFTWALWLRTAEDCSGNKVYLGTDDGSEGSHVWLGCAPAAGALECPDGPGSGRAAGTMTGDQPSTSDGVGFCGAATINDGEWHHVAAVKSGHAAATLELYVDGNLDVEVTGAFGPPILLPNAPPFTIGTFPEGGPYDAVGSVDEIAIWRRALSSQEIEALYRRAALDLEIDVRACEQPDCSDDPPFIGDDAAAGAPFRDPAGGLSAPVARALPDLPRTRYFQYRVTLSGTATVSPGFRAVAATAIR